MVRECVGFAGDDARRDCCLFCGGVGVVGVGWVPWLGNLRGM